MIYEIYQADYLLLLITNLDKASLDFVIIVRIKTQNVNYFYILFYVLNLKFKSNNEFFGT